MDSEHRSGRALQRGNDGESSVAVRHDDGEPQGGQQRDLQHPHQRLQPTRPNGQGQGRFRPHGLEGRFPRYHLLQHLGQRLRQDQEDQRRPQASQGDGHLGFASQPRLSQHFQKHRRVQARTLLPTLRDEMR